MLTNTCSERGEDGKSFVNPQTGVSSTAYDRFVEPISNGLRGGFDVHIYYFQVLYIRSLAVHMILPEASQEALTTSAGSGQGAVGLPPSSR